MSCCPCKDCRTFLLHVQEQEEEKVHLAQSLLLRKPMLGVQDGKMDSLLIICSGATLQ